MVTDGGQVTEFVADASLFPRAAAGSVVAATDAVFVTEPHRTSPVSFTPKVVLTLAPAASEERVQVRDQCSGWPVPADATTVHCPPGKVGTNVVTWTPRGRSSWTSMFVAVAVPVL